MPIRTLTPAVFAAALAVVVPAALTLAQDAAAPTQTLSAEQAREENAYAAGLQAFLWGYPLRYYGDFLPEALQAGGTYSGSYHAAVKQFPIPRG
jgi:hypothetical protein